MANDITTAARRITRLLNSSEIAHLAARHGRITLYTDESGSMLAWHPSSQYCGCNMDEVRAEGDNSPARFWSVRPGQRFTQRDVQDELDYSSNHVTVAEALHSQH